MALSRLCGPARPVPRIWAAAGPAVVVLGEQWLHAIAQLEDRIREGIGDARSYRLGPIARSARSSNCFYDNQTANHHVVACINKAACGNVGELRVNRSIYMYTSTTPMPVRCSSRERSRVESLLAGKSPLGPTRAINLVQDPPRLD